MLMIGKALAEFKLRISNLWKRLLAVVLLVCVFVCVCQQDSMELVFKQSKSVAVTSMSFPLGDVNNFVVGSEDGSVYTACRHGR